MRMMFGLITRGKRRVRLEDITTFFVLVRKSGKEKKRERMKRSGKP